MDIVMSSVLHTLCTDVTNPLMGLFDISVAPPLLSYAYIPLLVMLIVFGLTVAIRAHFSLKTRAILFFSVVLSFWLVNEIVQWVAIYHNVIFTAWRLALPLQAAVIFGWTAIAMRFYPESRTIRGLTVMSGAVMVASIFLFGSTANMSSYDIQNCEAVTGWVWLPFYIYQAIIVAWVIYLARRIVRAVPAGSLLVMKRRMLIGLSVIGASFVLANIAGELTGWYEVNLIIPIGVIIGIGFLLVTAAEYPVFSFKPEISEILVFLSLSLVGSLLLVPNVSSQRIVIVCTVIGLMVLGRIVVRVNHRAEKQRQQLEALTEKLRQLDQSKNEFISFATHQMRSPLVSIKWGTEALLDESISGTLAPQQRDLVTKVHDTATHMTETVNDLLNISKIEQGGLQLQCEIASVSDIVRQLVSQYEAVAAAKGLKLSMTSDADPYLTLVDVTKFRQVISNLIDNAIKYTDAGSITASLSKTNDMMTVAVTDTGRGMSSEDHQKLFQKFSRGAAGAANKGGSGLGLYLAFKIMELHGGSMTATSLGVGQGSSFIATLPIKLS
jgi:signal transduction histidine kinase